MSPAPLDEDLEFIFLGTGTSSALPHLDCLTAPPDRKPYRTCLTTLTPEGRKNIRRNTSGLFRIKGKDGQPVTVVIDTGKTFQPAALEWFPKYGLRKIDAVLITHAHADAMNGLDDLRGWTLRGAIQPHVDLYVSQTTYTEVQRSFPYLVSKEFASGGGDVPDFKWHIIHDQVPFEINDTGVWVTPFSVHHGRVFSTAPPPGCIPTPHAPPPEVAIPHATHPENGAIGAAAARAADEVFAPTPRKALKANGHLPPVNGCCDHSDDDAPPSPDGAVAAHGAAANGSAATNGASVNGPGPGAAAIQPYLCFGFKIQDALVYLSDVSHIPAAVWPLLAPPAPAGRPLPVLVLDCLRLAAHTSHFGLREALESARRGGAARTILTGFGHEVAHDEYEAVLHAAGAPAAARTKVLAAGALPAPATENVREGLGMVGDGAPLWVRPAFDGMRIVVGRDGGVVVDGETDG